MLAAGFKINDLVSGQDITLVGGCSYFCNSCRAPSEDSSVAQAVGGMPRLLLALLAVCCASASALPCSLTLHCSVLWLGNMASSLWSHCSGSLSGPEVPRLHSEWAENCWYIWWKHRGDGLSALWSECIWYNLGELGTAAKSISEYWYAAKREVSGIRTTGMSALLVTDSCSHGVMTAS